MFQIDNGLEDKFDIFQIHFFIFFIMKAYYIEKKYLKHLFMDLSIDKFTVNMKCISQHYFMQGYVRSL